MGKKITLPVIGAEESPVPSAAPASRAEGGTVMDEIDAEVRGNTILIYMKGVPERPMCGFSARAVQILDLMGRPYHAVDILPDPEKREAIKEYSDWPTIPQVYVRGEFIGGSDLLAEMYRSGTLQSLFDAAFEG